MNDVFKVKLIICVLLMNAAVFAQAQEVTDEAQKIYQQVQKSVYQIRVIDSATQKKTSIGSGFAISAQGHVVTNFHVISQSVHAPQLFYLEYVRHDGEVGHLTILDFDIVHDLAILKLPDGQYENYLSFDDSELSKGTKIFAMGNPHDLGMTVMEGIFNGLMKESLYRKILFSGSLNPGMSGGPALNREGKIIGINVATAGNEVSFLVPVDYLISFYQQLTEQKGISQWSEKIENQLIVNQDYYIGEILSSDWDKVSVGKASVPGELLDAFKCWGETHDIEHELFNHSDVSCSTEDIIYISSSMYTGQISYKYRWVESKGLGPIRFYNVIESFFDETHWYGNAQKDDATNFQCQTDFISNNNKDWKVGFCVRNYKKYKSLYDMNLSMVTVDEYNNAFLVEVVALGIQQSNALALAEKFIREIQWENTSSK